MSERKELGRGSGRSQEDARTRLLKGEIKILWFSVNPPGLRHEGKRQAGSQR